MSHEQNYADGAGSSSETLNQLTLSAPEMHNTKCEGENQNNSVHVTTLIKRKQRFEPKERIYLRNDLLLIVGYLEFFNALDFPANIWNTIPVPTFVVGLMATGGSLALIASTTAFIDLRRSLRNISTLAAERLFLQKPCSGGASASEHQQYIAAWSSLNFREYGWELIDRSLMDALVGFAAILVGVGTLMAIGGANPRIFSASNLLSGYIGNGFVALYSLVNAAWSGYLYIRARRHKRLTKKFIMEPAILRRAVQTFRNHQLYAVLNGVTLLVSGAASLLTAQFWWGYVMLIPCIVASVFCNILWRKKIGYNRVLKQFQPHETLEFDIYSAIQDTVKSQSTAQDAGAMHEKLELLSSEELLAFMDANEMSQDLCVYIANDPLLCKAIDVTSTSNEFTIDHQMLVTMDYQLLLGVVQTVVDEVGMIRMRDRERCLFELLGAHLHVKEQSKLKGSQNEAVLPAKTEPCAEQNSEKPKE